jgi:hypothetical protein
MCEDRISLEFLSVHSLAYLCYIATGGLALTFLYGVLFHFLVLILESYMLI